jgi:integrase
MSKVTAKEKDGQFRREVREGKFQQRAKRISFRTFSEKYLDFCRLNLKPKSAKRRELSTNTLMPYFGDSLLGKINPFMAEQFKKARRETGVKPATINRDIDCLKNILYKAVEWEYLAYNPLAGKKMKRLKEDNEVMWVLSDEEERKLLESCERSPQRGTKKNRFFAKYLRNLVELALNTGLREGELFNMQKTDVLLNERYIRVTDTKNMECRSVPINDTSKAILERRLQDSRSEYVFCNSKGKKLTVLTNAFWYAVKEAGLTRIDAKTGKPIRFRFHDLRHNFGSRLGMAGKDLKTIMEIMGHKSTKVAMRYQHPTPEHKLEAVKILDKKFPSKIPTGEIIEFKRTGNLG